MKGKKSFGKGEPCLDCGSPGLIPLLLWLFLLAWSPLSMVASFWLRLGHALVTSGSRPHETLAEAAGSMGHFS